MEELKGLTVIKRDGRYVQFNSNRIKDAIRKAYEEVYKNDEKFKEDVVLLLPLIENKLKNKEETTVEEIQDIVIDYLSIADGKVSRAYEEYRKERTEIREKNQKLYKDVLGIINGNNKDTLTENANKKGYMNSTQRDLIAGEVSKAMARKMIPKDIMNAHDKGAIKLHDLDYFINPIYNCELVNLEDMLQNGTVINNKLIEKPNSIRTAMNIATQISAQVASSQYGGQTISLTHLAPFVRISKEKIEKKFAKYPMLPEVRDQIIEDELKIEIKDAVQTLNYQVNTLQTCNGQSPFMSVCIYLNENPEYAHEVALLAEEIFKQRIQGMKNKFGIEATQTFPYRLGA